MDLTLEITMLDITEIMVALKARTISTIITETTITLTIRTNLTAITTII